MNDETEAVGLWDRTKAWADKNRTISGALVGGAAGTIVPGLGTVIGAIVGAGDWICLIEGKARRPLAAAGLIPENAGPQLRCRRSAPAPIVDRARSRLTHRGK